MTVITNPYFTEVVQGIEDELARNGYGLLLGDSHDDPDRELQMNAREKGKLDHTILERFYRSLNAFPPPDFRQTLRTRT